MDDKIITIQKKSMCELYQMLNQLDLGFVKNSIFKSYELAACPAERQWTDPIMALGVYYLFYKLAKKLKRADFLATLAGNDIDCKRYFTESERELLENTDSLKDQAVLLHRTLSDVAEVFEYEVWLVEHGLNIAYHR